MSEQQSPTPWQVWSQKQTELPLVSSTAHPSPSQQPPLGKVPTQFPSGGLVLLVVVTSAAVVCEDKIYKHSACLAENCFT